MTTPESAPKLTKKPSAPMPPLSLRGIAIEYAALGVALGLMFTRNDAALWNAVPLIGQHHLNQNFSNFAISLMLMLGIGVFPILQKRYKFLAYLAAGLIIANIFVETGSSALNVPDIRDTYAGILGVLFGLGCLGLIGRYGVGRPKVQKDLKI